MSLVLWLFARNSHQITLNFIFFERTHTPNNLYTICATKKSKYIKTILLQKFFFPHNFHTWDCSAITKGMKSFTHCVCCIGMSVVNITVKLFQRSVLTYHCSFSFFHLKYISHTYNFFFIRIEFFFRLSTKYHLDTFVSSCVFPFVFVPSRMDAIGIIDNTLKDDPNKIKSKQPKWSNVLCSLALTQSLKFLFFCYFEIRIVRKKLRAHKLSAKKMSRHLCMHGDLNKTHTHTSNNIT